MKIVRSLLKNLANANPNIWGYVRSKRFSFQVFSVY